MTRPTITPADLVNGQQGWDATLRDMLTAIVTNPLPVPEFADFASLPTASSYDRCLATTADDNKLYFSKGGAWKEVTVAV